MTLYLIKKDVYANEYNVLEVEVLKESEKQYKLEKNDSYLTSLNKADVIHSSFQLGSKWFAFGLTKALIVENTIICEKEKIKNHKHQIKVAYKYIENLEKE